MTTPSPIVAGKHSGIKVTVSPALKPVYDNLKQMGLKGNHWARVATQEIYFWAYEIQRIYRPNV